MESQEITLQITIYYVDGQQESFLTTDLLDPPDPEQSLIYTIRQRLSHPWSILHLPEESVFINMNNVLKVEVRPTLPEVQGEGVFPEAQRYTALTRSFHKVGSD